MRLRRWLPWLAVALGLVAVAIRVHNALHYFTLFGFDAIFHWRYVEGLLESGALPDPESGWSASRPPLFFVLSAGLLAALGRPPTPTAVIAVRLMIAAIGLVPALLTAKLVLRIDARRPQRALLAAALVLFVPAHIMMSAMFNEEILVATFTAVALYACCLWLLAARDERASEAPAALRGTAISLGVASGLASMTKLTGALSGVAGIGAMALASWRAARLRASLKSLVAAGLLVVAFGGAFYVSHWVRYGYLYPHSLEAHQAMYQMPPGNRRIGDYLRFPASTFTDPRAVTLDLQRSVWGSTYASFWFDSHRFFMPRENVTVTRVGTAILLLALLPSAAFGAGLARGARRVRRDPWAVEGAMLILVVLTLVGYAAYTWRNPWYATVKGGYLLGLTLPFGYLASEVLLDWGSGPLWRRVAVWGALTVLALLIVVAFTFGTPLWEWGPRNTLMPGFPFAVPAAP